MQSIKIDIQDFTLSYRREPWLNADLDYDSKLHIYILSDEALTLEDTGCGEYCNLKNQTFNSSISN